MGEDLKRETNLQNGTYRIEEVLGQGSFGITYLAVHVRLKKKVAIKEFFMSEVNRRGADGTYVEGSTGGVFTDYRRKFRKEAENLANLRHANIVNVSDIFDENGTTYYVMDFIEGTNLDRYINDNGHLSENEAIAITLEVGKALEYLHSKRLLHLDIKPSNIMRGSDGRYYLIDFGLSKQFSKNGKPEETTSIGLGTPGYAPIEQSSYKQDGMFPATLDVYALGATLYKMLTGHRPPEATDVLNEGFPVNEVDQAAVSESTIEILRKAMMPSYKRRYQSIRDFLQDLNHLKLDTQDDTTYEDVALVTTEKGVKSNKKGIKPQRLSHSWIKRIISFIFNNSSPTPLIIRMLLLILEISSITIAGYIILRWIEGRGVCGFDEEIVILLDCIVTFIGVLFLLAKKKYGISILIFGYFISASSLLIFYDNYSGFITYSILPLIGCLILWLLLICIKIKGVSTWSQFVNIPKCVRIVQYGLISLILFLLIPFPLIVALSNGFQGDLESKGNAIIHSNFDKSAFYECYLYKEILLGSDFLTIQSKRRWQQKNGYIKLDIKQNWQKKME